MEKLGIYARQSVEKETTGSIDDQIIEGKKQATVLNMPYEIYVDRGITAAKGTLNNRPEFMRLIADIKKGTITAIFVIDQSRLSRNQATQFYIKEILFANKVKVYTKLDGIIDYGDSDSELMADIRALFASKMVKDTSKKIKGVLLNNAMAGKAGGGATIPWGFKKDENKMLVQDANEVEVYKRMVKLSLKGIGSSKIAEILNKEGIKTRGAKQYKKGINIKNKYTGQRTLLTPQEIDWAPHTVISILKNSLYCGKRKFKGVIIPIAPIISEELWNELQRNLAKNKTYSGGKKVHFYQLKGLLRCERCGRNLYGYVKEKEGKQQRVYMCSSKREKKFCGMKSVNINRLEKLVWRTVKGSHVIFEKIIEDFNANGHGEKLKLINEKLHKIEMAINLLESKKDGLIDLYTENRINRNKYDEKSAKLINEEKLLNQQKEALEREKVFFNKYLNLESTGRKVEQLFENLNKVSKEEKAAILKHIIVDIRINYDQARQTHQINIIINPNGQIIQKELISKGEDNKEVDFDLLVPVTSELDTEEDYDDTRIILINGEPFDFIENNGRLQPRPQQKLRIKRQKTASPHVVTQQRMWLW